MNTSEGNMDDNLSKLERLLEEQIYWGYSDTALDHAMNPRNVGRVDRANGFGLYSDYSGDTMEMSIKVTRGVITDAMFWTDGSGSSMASGSMVTQIAIGKSVGDAMAIDKPDLLRALDGLPPEGEHCALLSLMALRTAILNYQHENRVWDAKYDTGA